MGANIADTVMKAAKTFDKPFTANNVLQRMKEMGYRRIPHTPRISFVLISEGVTYEKNSSKTNVYNPLTP